MGDMSPTQHEVFERLMVERLKAWMIWATRELSTCVLWFLNFFAKTIFKNWHNGGHVPYFLTYMFLTIRFLAVYWLKKSILTKVKGIMRTFHIWTWFCYCLMGDIVLMPPTRHEVFFTLKVGRLNSKVEVYHPRARHQVIIEIKKGGSFQFETVPLR